ncbi:GNAT family N-acetyltransferase [Rhodopirellula sallentina]|uniref:GCN5-like N-acetyltransferase n=1 Tax=Rhodopirellula sallentina SM41 TaxID=1263870 RepID=M5UDP9_9BACT|nr:N-acetyltransferase [Rhodopirellula sallentina]EMI55981.1 GCN5-like N-acetyltransferase [Rhodopirellula sallentina SM41]
MDVSIRCECEADQQAIHTLHRDAFECEDEANLVDALREGNHVSVSLVAETEGKVVGHILFSPVKIIADETSIDAVSLSPMAVCPKYQGLGIGGRLVRAGLDACRERGESIVVVLGHADYYPRFGFSAELAEPLQSPFGGGPAWMALELTPGALDGVQGHVRYAPPFRIFEAT